MRRTLYLAALLMAPAALSAQSSAAAPNKVTDEQLIAAGRQLTEWFYTGQADSIYSRMTADAAEKMPKGEFLQQRDMILARVGSEKIVVDEKMTLRRGNRQYWRESITDAMEEPVVLRWVFDADGKVIGLGINPKSRTPAPDA